MNKLEAFSKFLDTDYTEGSNENPINYLGDNTFEYMTEEYLVLTDEEANERAFAEVEETLWACNFDFMCAFIPALHKFTERELEETEKAIKQMQENLCERSNSIIKALLGHNLGNFIDEIIQQDGRGHILSRYDSDEHEEGEYFIYRIN